MKVIVVGGGACGIAAAYTLLAGGAEVSLYEARNRYGGRAVSDTTSINNFVFDMGCQYLQDPHVNPWSKIAEELKFDTVEEQANYRLRVQDPHGNWIDAETTAGNVGAIAGRIDGYFADGKANLNAPSIYRPAANSDDELLAYATTPSGPFTESAELWQYIAADSARQKELKEEKNNLFVRGGLGTLVKAYGDRLRQKFSFTQSLNAPVRSIRYRSNGVSVTATGRGPEPADACLVTVPPPVLAAGAITFDRPLPQTHREALEFLQLGGYKKVALPLTAIPVRPGNPKSEKADAIEVDTNYYCIQRNPHGVWQYYRLSLYPEVLVAHAAGDFARALDLKRDDKVVRMLQRTLQASYPTIQFGSASAVTNWTMDPYARGAYSYTAVKTRFDDRPGIVFDTMASFNGLGDRDKQRIWNDKTAYRARLQFREPLNQSLWFAGEATDVESYGTIAGAYNAGVSAASDILNQFSGKKRH
jgi:glycine/D-amino acid oxidase-like deaminating enzyme